MKWVLRILAVAFVLVLVAGYLGYRKYQSFTAAGNTASVAIAAPPARVFAALANTDSIAVWMGSNSIIGTERHGDLQKGDTLHVRSASESGNSKTSFTWTVTEVRANEILAMELRTDTSNTVLATRRDSLVVSGDSTVIHTTVGSPMLDRNRMSERDSNRSAAGGAMMNFGSKLAVSAFRALSENELKRLKAHIEGGK